MFDVNSGPVLYSTPDLLAIVFLGVIGGVLGSLYNYLVDKVLRTYSIINEYVISQQVNSFIKSFSNELLFHNIISLPLFDFLNLFFP